MHANNMAASMLVRVKCVFLQVNGRFILSCNKHLAERIYLNCTSTSRRAHTLTGRCVLGQHSNHHVYCQNILRRQSQALSGENVASVLQKCTSVQQQIETLYETLHLTPEDVENRITICRSIESVLKPYFPKCKIHLVGSSVNGFGLKGCDVDMSFQSGCPIEQISDSEFALIPSIKDVNDGTYALKDLHCLPAKVQLRFIRTVLEEYCLECSNPTVLSGRCPIVNFVYSKYGVKCDMSFNSQTAFYSTKLLHFYGKLDKRIPLLMVFLNYWSKRARLVGGITRFKTYALSLLMIYFLQTRQPPVVPTVSELFSKSDFFTSNEVWDYGVSADIGKIEPTKNTQSAEELLKEFFFFYLYFDFMKAILPLSGTSVDQALLAFCDEGGNKLDPNSICIEDPFELSWNVTCGVTYKYSKILVRSFLAVCKLYQDEALWSPRADNWGLMQLLNKNLAQDVNIHTGPVSFQISLPLQCESSPTRELGTPGLQNIPKEHLLQRISQAVLRVLEYGFLFKCTVLKQREVSDTCDTEEGRHLMREGGSVTSHAETITYSKEKLQGDVGFQNSNVLHLYCVAKNTLQGREACRQQVNLCDPNAQNVLEREHIISVRLCQQKKPSNGKQGFTFFCECDEIKHSELAILNITLRPTDGTHIPQKLAIFLKEYLPNIVKSVI